MKKIIEFLKVVWKWLVFSSANAEKISLTVKSILYALIPFILIITQAYRIQIDNAYLTAVIDQIIAIIIIFGGMVTAISAGFGALRKIYTTFTGTNAVVKSLRK